MHVTFKSPVYIAPENLDLQSPVCGEVWITLTYALRQVIGCENWSWENCELVYEDDTLYLKDPEGNIHQLGAFFMRNKNSAFNGMDKMYFSGRIHDDRYAPILIKLSPEGRLYDAIFDRGDWMDNYSEVRKYMILIEAFYNED